VRMLEHLHKLLYRQEFYLWTDHSAVACILKTSRDKQPARSPPTRVQLHFRALSRPKTQQCRCPYRWPCREECIHYYKDEVREDFKQVRAIAAVAAAGWDPTALRRELNDQDIGPILEEVETGQRPEWKDITDSSPCTKPLGSMEFPCCEEWHTEAPLENSRQTIKNSPDNSPSEQTERRADRTTWWTATSSLGCQHTSGYGPAKVLLAPGNDVKKWCRQC
jgi:hypothetical protein